VAVTVTTDSSGPPELQVGEDFVEHETPGEIIARDG
jgi:hypothetical protein